MMHTLSSAFSLFTTYARAGRVLNLKSPGSTRHVSVSERDSILSIVRHAISDGLGVPIDVDVSLTRDVLRALPEMARRRASREGLKRPSENARAAKVFAATIEANWMPDTRRPVGSPMLVPRDANDCPAGFRDLYDALNAFIGGSKENLKWRSMRGAFLDFAKLAVANGCTSPEMVTDRAQFDRWAADLEIARRHHLLSGWRKTIAVAGRPLPTLHQTIRHESDGLSGIEGLPAELRGLSTYEIIAHYDNDLKTLRDKYVTERDPSPATKEKLDSTLSWLLAQRVRGGVKLEALKDNPTNLLGLFEPQATGKRAATEADRLLEKHTGIMTSTTVHEAPMQAILTVASVKSSCASSLLMVKENNVVKDAVWFTAALRSRFDILVILLTDTFGNAMAASGVDTQVVRWARIQAEIARLRDHMAKHNKSVGDLTNHQDKGRLLVTWPQLVCLGLPALRRRAQVAKNAFEMHEAKVGKSDTRTGKRLWLAYEKCLFEYILFGIICADAMRVSNYTGGVCGVTERANFQIAYRRDADCRPIGINRVNIEWRRDDVPLQRLKKREHNDPSNRKRSKALESGLLDLDLLWDYVSTVRSARLLRRGFITGALDLDTDRFAMFIVACSGPLKKENNPTAHASEDVLSDCFGETLHWVCVEVLKLNERPNLLPEQIIPSWADLQSIKQHKDTDIDRYRALSRWKAVFGAHVIRNLYNVYFGRLRQNEPQAMRATDDTRETLDRNYSVYAEGMNELLHTTGMTNPHWFDAVIDAIIRPQHGHERWSAFWKNFNPANPSAALIHLEVPRAA